MTNEEKREVKRAKVRVSSRDFVGNPRVLHVVGFGRWVLAYIWP